MRTYRAFISYNHGDERIARKLHRRLEGYRPPKRLKPTPRRLRPVFRDRDELAAATDLPARVTAALKNSEHLVVLCSPRAAKSEWVNREVAAFAEMHGPDRIFPVIVEGEAPACFPPALLEATPNPLAADLQAGKDGFDDGALKLIAALLPAPFGVVKDREAARARRRTRITGGLAAVFALLLVAAVVFGFRAVEETRRANAELTRAEAAILTLVKGIEQLVDQIEIGAQTGSIPVAVAANLLETANGMAEKAIQQAPENALIQKQYSALLISFARHELAIGDREAAIAQAERAVSFAQRAATTIDRAYLSLGISYQTLGDALTSMGQMQSAIESYKSFERASRTFLMLNPQSKDGGQNLATSLESLGVHYLSIDSLDQALDYFQESLFVRHELSLRFPNSITFRRSKTSSQLYIAHIYAQQSRVAEALDIAKEALKIRRELYEGDALNALYVRDLSVALERVSIIYEQASDIGNALRMAVESRELAQELHRIDPDNVSWRKELALALDRVALLKATLGEIDDAIATLHESAAIHRTLASRDPTNAAWAQDLLVALWTIASHTDRDGAEAWGDVVTWIEVMKRHGVLPGQDEEVLSIAREHLAASLAD